MKRAEIVAQLRGPDSMLSQEAIREAADMLEADAKRDRPRGAWKRLRDRVNTLEDRFAIFEERMAMAAPAPPADPECQCAAHRVLRKVADSASEPPKREEPASNETIRRLREGLRLALSAVDHPAMFEGLKALGAWRHDPANAAMLAEGKSG